MKACRRMLVYYRIIVAVFALLVFAPIALAQINPNLEIGFKPYGSYDETSLDTVNLTNGNLTLHIPLFDYPQRGNLKSQVRLSYNSKGWYVSFDCTSLSCLAMWDWMGYPPNPFGVQVLLDSGEIAPILGTWKGPGGTIWTFSGQSSDGDIHQLAQTGLGGYSSIDGTGLYLNDPTGVYGPYVMLDRAGNGFNPAGSGWSDTNGNYYSYNSNYVLTDTLDRPLGTSVNDGSGTAGCSTASGLWPVSYATIVGYPGPNGGTRLVKLCSATFTVKTNFNARVTDPLGNDIKVAEVNRQWGGVQSVIVFDGTSWATSPQWTFLYNDTDGQTDGTNYGNLTQVTLPTGGTITYTWHTDTLCQMAWTSRSRVVDSRTINANDGLGPQPTAYGIGEWGASVTDPAGNVTEHKFTELVACSPYETETDYYKGSGTLLKTVLTSYTWTTNPFDQYNDGAQTAANVEVSSVTTKWPIPNSTNFLVSQVQTDYDTSFNFAPSYLCSGGRPYPCGSFGRLNEKREYGYGLNSPGPLMRRTDYTYAAAATQGNSYLTANLLDLVTDAVVYDGSGSKKEETVSTYDGTALQSSGVTQQHLTTLPNPGIRGNLTLQQKWLNTTGGLATTKQIKYYDTGMPYQSTDLKGNVTAYSYDPVNYGAYLTQTQYPNTGSPAVSHSISGVYDFNTGLLTNFTDQNSQPSNYGYDILGRITSASYPDGGSVGLSYTDTVPMQIQKSVAVTGSLNKVTNSVFDGLGRLSQTQAHDPDCQVGSQLVKVDYTYGYDTNQNSHYSTVTTPYCDTAGPVFGLATRTDSDALGRVVKVTDPDSSVATTSYAANTVGFTITATDEAGATRKNQIDGLGRMTFVWEDPSNRNYETDYGYDLLGNLASVNQKGDNTAPRTRSFVFDSLSRLTSATNPESGTISYTYSNTSSGCAGDPGAVCTKIAPAPNALPPSTATVTTTYSYDNLLRLKQKSYSDGTTPTVSFGYDGDTSTLTCSNAPALTDLYPKGGRTAMCDGSGATSWAHDKMGRVVTDKQLIAGATAITNSVGYSYNFDGSLATMTYPSNRVVTYTPNSSSGFTAGRAVSAVEAAHSINYVTGATYTPNGAITAFTNGANITGIQTYNVRLQPMELYYTSGSTPAPASSLQQPTCPSLPSGQVATIMHRAYDFHLGTDNGNVYTINNCLASDRTQNFDYDSLNRLVDAYTTGTSTAQKNWGAIYSIDPWGNMYNVGPYPGRVNYPPALTTTATTKNQLTGFGYDIAGNTVSNGSASYVYDAENRITSTAGTSYRYDGDGERVVKCSGTYPSCSSGTLYWKGTGSDALAEVDWTGTITSEYMFFGGKRVAQRYGTANIAHYFFADHLGSAAVITGPTGTKSKESDYQPYGNEVVITGALFANNYKFNGKERDAESGLDNFGARYNASNIGRFMTPDWAAKPVTVPYANFGNPQSLNLYAYVENNPTTLGDPDGHENPSTDSKGTVCDNKYTSCKKKEGEEVKAAQNKPAVSATVEGGYGLEGKAHIGPVEVKGGAAVKGEVEVSSDGTKVSAKAEVGGNIGPVKLPGGQAEVVTKNEKGESEAPTVSFTKPGISSGKTEATGWKNEITVGVSLYPGFGGGVSVTIRPTELFNSAVNWLTNHPSAGVDFNTNQQGMGGFQ